MKEKWNAGKGTGSKKHSSFICGFLFPFYLLASFSFFLMMEYESLCPLLFYFLHQLPYEWEYNGRQAQDSFSFSVSLLIGLEVLYSQGHYFILFLFPFVLASAGPEPSLGGHHGRERPPGNEGKEKESAGLEI